MNNDSEIKKVIPYRTSTGLEIGKFYEPKDFGERNRDMDIIQLAFIKNPSEDKYDWAVSIFYGAIFVCFLITMYLLTKN